MEFHVSVIIPAYNVERFIEKAVKSALDQPQVKEIVVIDDGSTDKTRFIIQSMIDDRIKLIHHENNINKGRSATRNLGIQNAKSDYIAFLDADDYYLPHRFENDYEVFRKHKDAIGLYNAVGFYIHDSRATVKRGLPEMTTIIKVHASQELGVELVRGIYGHIHLNGLTIKRREIAHIQFPEHLPVAEDTAWIWKLAFTRVLLPSELDEPVAMRCVHDSNVFNNSEIYLQHEQALFKEMVIWSINQSQKLPIIELFVERLWIIINRNHKGIGKLLSTWIRIFVLRPRLLFSYLSYHYFPLVYKWKSIKNKIS
jgi:glycosyltransferase involved in cell wall biosynthesis